MDGHFAWRVILNNFTPSLLNLNPGSTLEAFRGILSDYHSERFPLMSLHEERQGDFDVEYHIDDSDGDGWGDGAVYGDGVGLEEAPFLFNILTSNDIGDRRGNGNSALTDEESSKLYEDRDQGL